MENTPLTKEQQQAYVATRFKKTPQEKAELKAAKAAWKKSQKHEQTKG